MLRLFILLVLLPFVVHIAFYYSLPLHPDEAFYWSLSQELSLSYYISPGPLVAWLLVPLSWFGEISPIKIRLLATLFIVLSGLVLTRLLMLIIRDHIKNDTNNNIKNNSLITHKSIILFAYTLLISPATLLIGTIWTNDSPLMLFLSLCLLSFYHAYNGKAKSSLALKHWIMCSIWFGLAFLSKYSAVFWGGSAFLLLLTTVNGRRHLVTPAPWIAMVISFVFCLPVIVWNAMNEWVGFTFHINHLIDNRGLVRDSESNTHLFIGGLIIVVGPAVVFTLIRMGLLTISKKIHTNINLIVFIAYIPLLFLLVISFFNDVHLNWIAFTGLLMLMLFSIYNYQLTKFATPLRYIHYVSQILLTGLLFYVIYTDHPSLSKRFFSYEKLSYEIDELQKEYPNAYLFGTSYQVHAILCFSEKELLPYKYILGINSHYEYIDKQIPTGEDVLLFSFNSDETKFSKYFDNLQQLEPIELTYKGKSRTTIYPFLGTNNQF